MTDELLQYYNQELAYLMKLGAETERNEVATWVVTGRGGKTTVPGVYAAGNVVEPMAQVIGAAASGAMAGAAINMDLVEEEFDQAQALLAAARGAMPRR